jgi:hypothetical protein
MNITWQKVTAVAVGFVAIVGAIQLSVGLASEVQTDSEAKVWRSDHVLTEAEKFKLDRIDRVTRENDRLEYDLIEPGLSTEQVKFKERQIIKNDKKIECIRADTC